MTMKVLSPFYGTLDAFYDNGNSGSGTVTIDYLKGRYQKVTITGACTLALSNIPPAGVPFELFLEVVNAAAYAVTWPSILWRKPDNTYTSTLSASGIVMQASGTNFITLYSRTGGSTIYGWG